MESCARQKPAPIAIFERVEAPDDFTVVIRLKEPFAALLWNLSDGAMGVVPNGSGEELARHPIGTGPFRFVSEAPDREVVIERNEQYWGKRAELARVRFNVVPDATTRALELRKGSADAEINALPGDMVSSSWRGNPSLLVERAPGTSYQYLAINLRDPILKNVAVRQALAYAIDRKPLIHYLWHDMARPETVFFRRSIGPTMRMQRTIPTIRRRLANCSMKRDTTLAPDGVRFHLVMKTSTDESTRSALRGAATAVARGRHRARHPQL